MIYEIAICDDDRRIVEELERLLKSWGRSRSKRLSIKSFLSSEAFLFDYEEDKKYHILLLDIEMPGMNGVDLAEKIRAWDRSVEIIFITGYMDYIARGYDVEALNYLLKPVDEVKLFEVLDKAVNRIGSVEKFIYVDTGEGMLKLDIHTIVYAEVDKNYTTIYTEDDRYRFKQTLKSLEDKLDDRFFRTSRSFLVNLKYVKKVSRTSVDLANGVKIPLARKKYEEINRAIIEYF